MSALLINTLKCRCRYTEEEIGQLETIWGKGFLSPGGPEEVAQLIMGMGADLRGKSVLDIGCGVGGVDLLLVQTYGASSVHAVDMEAGVLTKTAAYAHEAGVDCITTQQISRSWEQQPELIVTPPGGYDIVFSKDAIVHAEDKGAVMCAVFSLLRPGGEFLCSDWMCSESIEVASSPEWDSYMEKELSVKMKSLRTYESALTNAGFTSIRTRDRNEWYCRVAAEELDLMVNGDVRATLEGVVGQESTLSMVETWRRMVVVLQRGEHRPGHIYAVKPE
eukprot:COSAG02_NODE_6278_length_3683_cov_3.575893_2_plen_277_part_00